MILKLATPETLKFQMGNSIFYSVDVDSSGKKKKSDFLFAFFFYCRRRYNRQREKRIE